MLNALGESRQLKEELFKDTAFIEDRDEVWISSRECLQRNLDGIKVESVGMLFARKKNKLEMTVNAVQLFCSTIKAIELTREESMKFIEGEPIATRLQDGEYIAGYGKSALDVGVVKQGPLKRRT